MTVTYSAPTRKREVSGPVVRSDESGELRALYQRLLDSWGRGDGYAYAAHFTEDADYVAFDGSHTVSRKVIGESHHQLFQTWLKGTRLVGEVTKVRLLGDDVAVVHAVGDTIMPGKQKPSPDRRSIQTLVAVKRDGRWLFCSFHNTRVRPLTGFQKLMLGFLTRFAKR
jgi:uncharacterized protein (TIGR02246 family)